MNREQRRKLTRAAKKKAAHPTIDARLFEINLRNRLAQLIREDQSVIDNIQGEDIRARYAHHYANLIEVKEQESAHHEH